MNSNNLPKLVLLHRSRDEHYVWFKRLLNHWQIDIIETEHLVEIHQREVLDSIPVALSISKNDDASGIVFLRSVMHANNWIQRFFLTSSTDINLIEQAINKAHINYLLKYPPEEDKLASYLRKAYRRYQDLTKPFAKIDALTSLTQDLLLDNERYRLEATTDALTHLMNRGTFNNMLQRFWQLFIEQGFNFSIAMLDLDHFKNVNDTYGHSAGDRVLKIFAEIISGNHRLGMDYAFRYGGEEFAIISTNTNSAEMKIYIDRLLAKVRNTPIRYEQHEISVTCSAGITQAHPCESPEMLISHADEALYLAKAAGRDRTLIYEFNKSPASFLSA